MDAILEALAKDAPTAAALLIMVFMHHRRDESRDERFSRVVERQIESDAATRSSLDAVVAEVREMRREFGRLVNFGGSGSTNGDAKP